MHFLDKWCILGLIHDGTVALQLNFGNLKGVTNPWTSLVSYGFVSHVIIEGEFLIEGNYMPSAGPEHQSHCF